jgi:hypothetical protein
MSFAFCMQANARFAIGPSFHFYQQNPRDTFPYPIQERRGDPYSSPGRSTFDFRDTGYLKRTIEYDPKTKQYYIVEKIGRILPQESRDAGRHEPEII